MNYQVERVPGEAILVCRVFAAFRVEDEWDALHAALRAALDSADQPLLYVSVVENIEIDPITVMDLLNTLTIAPGALFTHPNLRSEYFLVTNSVRVRTGAQTIEKLIPGRIRVYPEASEYLALHKARTLLHSSE